MSDEERVPLISNRSEQTTQDQSDSVSLNSFKQKLNLRQWLKEEWPILRILVSAFLWSVAKFGAVGPLVEFYRIFVCAEYFYRHPELSLSDGSSNKPSNMCSIPEIEARMSTINLVVTLLSAATSALGLLLFTPLLSKGRRRVLICGLAGTALTSLPFIVLPVGYPFAQKDQTQTLNPEQVILIFMISLVLANLLAPEDLPLLGCRVLLNDRSSAQRRTRNLNWLTISYLGGLSLAPGFVSGICRLLPSLSASSIDGRLFRIGSKIIDHHQSHDPTEGHPIGTAPVPVPPQDTRNSDVMPFIVVMVFAILAMLWTYFVIPESAGLRDLEDKNAHEEALSIQNENKSSRFLSALSILAPKRDNSGSRDWRLLQIATAAQLIGSANLGLDPLVFFVGYSLKWTPTEVSMFISWLGTSRAIALFSLIPLLLAYFTRTTKKPRDLARLSKEEMDRISKNPIEVEDELEREEELEDNLENQNENARVSQIYRDERELLRLQEQVESDSKLRHSLSMWRAKVDFKLVKFSILFDLLGWASTFAGAQISASTAIILGSVLLSFSSGLSGSLYSVGVSTAIDMHHKGMDVGGSTQQASDAFMGASSLLDAIAKIWAPAIHTSIYRASLGSVLPGAPFLFASFLCLLAFLLVLGFKSGGRGTP